MGFLSSLFGEKAKTEVKPTTTISPEQQQILSEQLLPFFTEQGPISEFKGEPFTGDFAAQLSGLEQTSLAALEERARASATGDTPIGAASTALQDILKTGGAGGQDFESFFRASVEEPLLERFTEDIIPDIGRRFSGGGFFGGERREAQQRAGEDLIESITRARTTESFKERGAEFQRVLQAAGIAPGVQTGGTQDLLSILQAGGVPRAIEQAQLTGEYGEFQRQQEERNRRIAQMLQALGVPLQENIVTQTGGSKGLLGLLAPIAGSFLGGPGAAGLFGGGAAGAGALTIGG